MVLGLDDLVAGCQSNRKPVGQLKGLLVRVGRIVMPPVAAELVADGKDSEVPTDRYSAS